MTRDPLDELLDAMARLLEEQDDSPPVRPAGEGNFRCQRCEGCDACRFCSDCLDCVECTYCDGCVACSGCTQSRNCRDCQSVSHSQLSRACDDSSYLTLCIGCEQCVHCFACVAMQSAEFCILNEKLSRKDYNARIAELRVALERRLATGWRPGWLRDEDEDEIVAIATDDELAALESPRVVPAIAPPVIAPPVIAPPVIAPPVIAPPVTAPPLRATERAQSIEPVRVVVDPPTGPSVMRARPPRADAGAVAKASVTSARRPPRRD